MRYNGRRIGELASTDSTRKAVSDCSSSSSIESLFERMTPNEKTAALSLIESIYEQGL